MRVCDRLEYKLIDPAQIPCTEISDPALLVKKPLVSVKMITYNHEPYIAQAIEGVLQQKTTFPIELIIGEDCSTDGTRKIVLEYQKKYPNVIRVLTSDQNVGARRNGIRTDSPCRGKYIAYCEGDDYWHDLQKLQKQVDFLEQNPDYGAVHSDVVLYDVSQKKARQTRKQIALDDAKAYEEILTAKRFVWTPTVCVRHSIIKEAIKRNTTALYNADWPMGDTPKWLEFAQLSNIKYLDEKLATRNLLPESASRSKCPEKMLSFYIASNDMLFYYLKKYPISRLKTKKIISYRLSKAMCLAYELKRWDIIRDAYKQLLNNGCRVRLIHYLYCHSSSNPIIYYLLYPWILIYKKLNKMRMYFSVILRK